ncbi:IS1182 family transposase [Desulfoluna spongiiphila]|uniref:Transposase, IS4 family n=1 Tax=Desulfoluna spongiiphila TaxID=419481 RepID=A0A1G5GZR6_9BACT|nr:IS1182 family transposase [Desulfoluna spongiiphila]SCY56799.1 transposase, IS4 family [Desulfoluna spongiiphila]
MARYKSYSQAQSMFIPVRFDEQIIPGTFVHAIDHLVDNELDLSIFDKHYSNDKTGAPAYNPAVLLKVILYAYSLGIISSRKIASCCECHVTFIALAGDTRPHFTTIAKFISSYGQEISVLLTRVIAICSMEGLIGKKMFAIDGCKLSSNASKEWSGTREDFDRKKAKIEKSIQLILKKHQAQDKGGDEGFDMTAKEKKAVKSLKKKADKIQAWLDEGKEKIGVQSKPIQSNLTDNESAKMSTSHGVIQGYTGIAIADDLHQVITHAEAHGSSTEHLYLKDMIDGARKAMNQAEGDNDSLKDTIVTADTGFHSSDGLKWIEDEKIEAYIPDKLFRKRDPNFATADRHKRPTDKRKTVKKAKYFKASEFVYDPEKKKLICPAGNELYVENSNFKDQKGLKGITSAAKKTDCRACELRSKCIRGKKVEHRHVTVFTNTMRQTDTPVSRMIKRFDTPKGRFWYSRRMGTIEPVFANIRSTLGLNRFTLRGRAKVDTQWKLFAMVHNIGKLARYAWC